MKPNQISSRASSIKLRVELKILEYFPHLIVLSAVLFFCCSAHAQNHLSGFKKEIADTFGKNSDVPNMLYGGETLGAVAAYMKTKSMFVFIGLPVLMLFTSWGLGKAGL